MTFSHFNRRLHLYLGLALLPWFFMYGISSVPFAHNQFFEQRDAAKGLPLWTLRSEHTVDLAVPDDPAALRSVGAALLETAGIEGTSFGAYRQSPTQINVYSYSFWTVDAAEVLRRPEEADGGGSPLPLGSLSDRHARARRLRAGGRAADVVEHRGRRGLSGDDRVDRVRPLHVVGASRSSALGRAGDSRRRGLVRRVYSPIVGRFANRPCES